MSADEAERASALLCGLVDDAMAERAGRANAQGLRAQVELLHDHGLSWAAIDEWAGTDVAALLARD